MIPPGRALCPSVSRLVCDSSFVLCGQRGAVSVLGYLLSNAAPLLRFRSCFCSAAASQCREDLLPLITWWAAGVTTATCQLAAAPAQGSTLPWSPPPTWAWGSASCDGLPQYTYKKMQPRKYCCNFTTLHLCLYFLTQMCYMRSQSGSIAHHLWVIQCVCVCFPMYVSVLVPAGLRACCPFNQRLI